MTAANVFLVLAFDHPTRAVESVGDRMAAGLCTLGFDAAVLSLPRDAGKLAQLPPSRVCGVLSLGPLPLSVRLGDRPLWEHFDCPVSLYLLDAILYDMARVPVMGDFLNAARTDARLGLVAPETGYRDWLGDTLSVQWDHVPFAAFPCVQRGPLARAASGAQGVLPRVAVIGTIGNELGGTPAGETLAGLLGRVGGAHGDARQLATLHDALLAPGAAAMPALTVARELGWGPGRAFDRSSLGLLVAVDSWIKRQRRIEAVASLAGLPVDFYGTGWREHFGDVPGFNYIGRVAHDHIARVLAHYRATVNFDPNWEGGMHDRVYSAAAMGTHVFTNANTGLAAAGLPADLVTTYDATRPRLAELVNASGVLASNAASGARIDVLARHNWGSRMAQWLGSAASPRIAAAAPATAAPATAAPAFAVAPATQASAAPRRRRLFISTGFYGTWMAAAIARGNADFDDHLLITIDRQSDARNVDWAYKTHPDWASVSTIAHKDYYALEGRPLKTPLKELDYCEVYSSHHVMLAFVRHNFRARSYRMYEEGVATRLSESEAARRETGELLFTIRPNLIEAKTRHLVQIPKADIVAVLERNSQSYRLTKKLEGRNNILFLMAGVVPDGLPRTDLHAHHVKIFEYLHAKGYEVWVARHPRVPDFPAGDRFGPAHVLCDEAPLVDLFIHQNRENIAMILGPYSTLLCDSEYLYGIPSLQVSARMDDAWQNKMKLMQDAIVRSASDFMKDMPTLMH